MAPSSARPTCRRDSRRGTRRHRGSVGAAGDVQGAEGAGRTADRARRARAARLARHADRRGARPCRSFQPAEDHAPPRPEQGLAPARANFQLPAIQHSRLPTPGEPSRAQRSNAANNQPLPAWTSQSAVAWNNPNQPIIVSLMSRIITAVSDSSGAGARRTLPGLFTTVTRAILH